MREKKTNKKKVPYFKSLKFVDDFVRLSRIIEFCALPQFSVWWFFFLTYYDNSTFMKALYITNGIYSFVLFLICIISKKLNVIV